jgi:hypothetical protein
MTYGTSANTHRVATRLSRSSPHRRSRTVPVGKPQAIQHMRRGLMAHTALRAHFPHANLIGHPPAISPNTASKTSCPRDQLRLPSLETSHPPRQDAQVNYLDILTIFVKQRTYLAILPLFGHLARLVPQRQRNSKKAKRNLFCATPLRSPQDLVRLLRFLRTFLQASSTPATWGDTITPWDDDVPPLIRHVTAFHCLLAEIVRSTPGHDAGSQLWTTMGTLSQLKFSPSLGCRCCQVAKRADGINRLVRINAVEELVVVHVFPDIFSPHLWVPKTRA